MKNKENKRPSTSRFAFSLNATRNNIAVEVSFTDTALITCENFAIRPIAFGPLKCPTRPVHETTNGVSIVKCTCRRRTRRRTVFVVRRNNVRETFCRFRSRARLVFTRSRLFDVPVRSSSCACVHVRKFWRPNSYTRCTRTSVVVVVNVCVSDLTDTH